MKKKLEKLIRELTKEAKDYEYTAKHGSSVTSMSDDITYGQIAEEQRKIISKLRKILKDA